MPPASDPGEKHGDRRFVMLIHTIVRQISGAWSRRSQTEERDRELGAAPAAPDTGCIMAGGTDGCLCSSVGQWPPTHLDSVNLVSDISASLNTM